MAHFPVDEVVGFWRSLPMRWEGRELSTYGLLSHLWRDKAKVPMVWDYSVGEALDVFLSERGQSILEFYRKILYRNNHGTYLQGKVLLKWFYPVMKAAFNVDARDIEEVGILSDARPLHVVVWKHAVEESNEVAYIDGRRVGRRIDFDEFLRVHDLDLSAYKVPARRCVLMEEDYFCPQRKRVVLRAGCAYDAPAYLHTIRHKIHVERDLGVLGHIVDDIEDEEGPLARAVKDRHEAALTLVREKVRLTWHPEDETLSCNGETLVKGVPAKILKLMVHAYLSEGRVSFEYREFKRDFDISLGQKNSNFEVRFYRLIERLQEKCPSLAIAKAGRGRIELQVRCELSMEG